MKTLKILILFATLTFALSSCFKNYVNYGDARNDFIGNYYVTENEMIQDSILDTESYYLQVTKDEFEKDKIIFNNVFNDGTTLHALLIDNVFTIPNQVVFGGSMEVSGSGKFDNGTLSYEINHSFVTYVGSGEKE
jgi:PBP1b-binding outer membrane lipoprotein LpoB